MEWNALMMGLLGCFSAGLLLMRQKQQSLHYIVLEDEDIKIAPGSFSSANLSEDLGEIAALEFLQQKKLGNIEKARHLGQIYARALIQRQGPLQQQPGDSRVLHHSNLLYSYVVNRVIAECSPNSILAQTSLNVFYEEIEGASTVLYQSVSDMAAFSLYILCQRSQKKNENDIGKIFADLCDCKADQQMIDLGNRLYQTYLDYCKEQMELTSYRTQ